MLSLDKNNRYLLACSFGPDSMALFHMLLSEGFSFEVAHVNYHLREESTFETEGLEKYCEENRIKLHIRDVTDFDHSKNIEEECRNIRYAFFASIINNNKDLTLLVAHNEDDNIETFLMQKKRRNLPTYFGIKKETQIFGVKVVRPLLDYKKSFLQQYCDQNKVPYSIDSSNLSDAYLRNRIRHSIVEPMTDEERQHTLQQIDENNEEIAGIFSKLHEFSPNDIFSYEHYSSKEMCYAFNQLLHEKFQAFYISKNMSFELLKIINSEKPNVTFKINSKISFEKSYDKVAFVSNEKQGYFYTLSMPTKLDNEYFFLDFSNGAENRNVYPNDYPLTIRTFEPGDTYLIKDYFVKVNRLFIDWKMPLRLRKRWPLILNKEGKIIYIPRYRKDFVIDKNLNFYVK